MPIEGFSLSLSHSLLILIVSWHLLFFLKSINIKLKCVSTVAELKYDFQEFSSRTIWTFLSRFECCDMQFHKNLSDKLSERRTSSKRFTRAPILCSKSIKMQAIFFKPKHVFFLIVALSVKHFSSMRLTMYLGLVEVVFRHKNCIV